MISFPGCKINLGLQIIARRSDGYHDITSIMYPLKINDILEIVTLKKDEKTKFTSSGLLIPGSEDDNLCLKAYNLLNKKYNLPSVHIHLHKCIPMGGGLGGGSSNGAETINLLNKIFDLGITINDKKKFAAELGSDCPFFIENTPQFATGTGTALTLIDLDLSGYYLILLNVGIHVSTKEAYSGVHLNETPRNLREIIKKDISEWKNHLYNDFEKSVFKLHPSLEQIKSDLYSKGAIYASMTGSGSTLYGVFKEAPCLITPEYGFLKVIKL